MRCVKSVQIRSFSWSVFSRIRTEYGDFPSKSPYSCRIRENMDQKKTPYLNTFYTVHGCAFGVDGFNLSKIPHDFACVILQTETLAPVSIKTFTTRSLMNKSFLKSCFLGILNLGPFCDNFTFQIFNWYLSFLLPLSSLFTPSILLSLITFMVFCWRNEQLYCFFIYSFA